MLRSRSTDGARHKGLLGSIFAPCVVFFCPFKQEKQLLQLVDAFVEVPGFKSSFSPAEHFSCNEGVRHKPVCHVVSVVDHALQEGNEVWTKTSIF